MIEQIVRELTNLKRRLDRLESLEGTPVWADWTPTVTQSGAVTVTVNNARYRAIGKSLRLQGTLTVIGSGTSGFAIVIGGLPVAAAYAAVSGARGAARIFRSGVTDYACTVLVATTTTLQFTGWNNTSNMGIAPAFGLAVNDQISFECEYESV